MKLSLQHIHIQSKDKIKLANWYCEQLGFKIIADIETVGELNGPVYITSDDGLTGLTIFSSQKEPKNVFPAFGADVKTFFKLYEQFHFQRIYDHYEFFSFYLKDLDNNKLEICCTEYRTMKKHLEDLNVDYFLMTPETYTP